MSSGTGTSLRKSMSLTSAAAAAFPNKSLGRMDGSLSKPINSKVLRSRTALESGGGDERCPIPSTTTIFDSTGRAMNVIRRNFEAPDKPTRSQSSPPKRSLKQSNQQNNQHHKMSEYFSRGGRTRSNSIPSKSDTRIDFNSNLLPNRYDKGLSGINNCKARGSENSLLKVSTRKPSFPVSETKQCFNTGKGLPQRSVSVPVAVSKSSLGLLSANSGVGLNSKLDDNFGESDKVDNYDGRRQRSEDNLAVVARRRSQKGSNYESHKMKNAKSEVSLLEQKKLQWAKEKEELNGLWSPWGRTDLETTPVNLKPSESTIATVSSRAMSSQMQTSYPPPSNVVSSSYIANLQGGISSPTISVHSQSHSECYLPPINSTIAQQPRQKAKVWNVEFQQEDYRYENDTNLNNGGHQLHHQPQYLNNQHSHHHRPSVPNNNSDSRNAPQRKSSLPNYPCENGESFINTVNNCNYQQHQQMLVHQYNKLSNQQPNLASWESGVNTEEETFTSGYYSSENNNNDDIRRTSRINGNGGRGKEIILKPTSRERCYQEEVTVQKAIAVKGKGDSNGEGKMVMHKIYTQNGELLMERDGNEEVIVNSMTVEMNGGRMTSSDGGNFQYQNHPHDSGRSPGGNPALPRNHAMRSSLTIGVDARAVDAYYENDKREKEQWLNELEKQREEQRLRKMMEKEERRPRWGDRGIGVGHFWEPAASENSHLPAPPLSSRNSKDGSGGGSLTRSESHAGRIGGGDSYIAHNNISYPQSQTPPAWLERSLTRMQSSKSQPSLHDSGEYNDYDYSFDPNHGNYGAENRRHNNTAVSMMENSTDQHHHPNQQRPNLVSSRSLNQSAVDLRNVAGYYSPNGESDKTFLRGQNVPVDPDLLSEREKKRQANQEHLEALKKQIEERQQMQKEEKERREREEREQEMRMAKQREIELQRLEMEKRGRIPVNGDMPNSVEDGALAAAEASLASAVNPSSKLSSMVDRPQPPVRNPSEEKDIEIVQRQSVMVQPTEDDDKTTESSTSYSNNTCRRLSRQDQSVMTISTEDGSDPQFERTLTPSIQRSRSLSLNRTGTSREFGTQTELSDDKKREKEQQSGRKESKKSEERPRWGSNPVKKQYIKQSEKDPNYFSRMKRRQERLRKMEEERSARGDTGTESEDVNIPFHRIRQRRHEGASPQRKPKGLAPLKAITSFLGGKYSKENGNSSGSSASLNGHGARQITNMVDEDTMMSSRSTKNRWKSTVDMTTAEKISGRSPRREKTSVSHSHTKVKNAKSESNLNNVSRQHHAADIIDRNFGSVAGVNSVGAATGTSEESSGFSTPFLPRRNLGTGSTESGSGTTGSGSGVQSPDLAYQQHHLHNSRTYQVTRTARDERKLAQLAGGRDPHSTSTKTSHSSSRNEFSSAHKGFIHQKDFDEMPIKSAKLQSHIDTNAINRANAPTVSRITNKKEIETKNKKPSQRNASVSPARKNRSPARAPRKNNKEAAISGDSFETLLPSVSSTVAENNLKENNLPNISSPYPIPPGSPPVPALLKKMQMGLHPDESGRISSLPTEFPDILAPLPPIPLRLISPANPPSPALSRLSSATSGASSTSAAKIDIDIAVTPRRNPELVKLFEAAEERIKERQLTAILASSNNMGNDSARSRRSFETDIGSISINLEPITFSQGEGIMEQVEFEIPASARLSIRSRQTLPSSRTAVVTSRNNNNDTDRHGAFIASVLNRKEVLDQLSARESELSEKGIIEFSIKLPSNSSGDDLLEEYKDPLLTERRRNTVHWLYGGQNPVPQKQAILTNLASLKKGISPSQKETEWKVHHSDSEFQ